MSHAAYEVARLAMEQGLDPSIHLSPSLPGEATNASPTFGDLALRPGAFPGWEGRLQQAHAQLAGCDPPFGEDAAGWHLALPERDAAPVATAANPARGLRTWRNDVARAAPPAPTASAQFNDRVTGSWGASLFGGESLSAPMRAEVFRYQGGAWRPAAAGRWNRARARFDNLVPAVPPSVADGLARALLALPTRVIAVDHETVRDRPWWGGNRSWNKAPDADIELPVRLAAQATCLFRNASRHGFRTKARAAAEERAQAAAGFATAAVAEVCAAPGEPVAAGTPCDRLMGALEDYLPPPCDASPSPPPCPHVVTPATLSEWREGSMPPVGPYETSKPHAVGATPCCFYHPVTQARYELHRKVHADIMRRNPAAGASEIYAAIADAERDHRLAESWEKCDEQARAEAARGGVAGVGGRGGASGIAALAAFYKALQAEERNAARGIWAQLQSEFPAFDGQEMPLDSGDRVFWDVAHRAAHDSRNVGYLKWAHDAMRAQGIEVIHVKTSRNGPLEAVRAAGRAVAAATRAHAALRSSDDLAELGEGTRSQSHAAEAAKAAMAAATAAGFGAEDVQRAYDDGVAAALDARTRGNPGGRRGAPPSRRPALEIALNGMPRDGVRDLCLRFGVAPPDVSAEYGSILRDAARRIDAAGKTDDVLASLGAERVVFSPGSILPARVPAVAAPPALTVEQRRSPWCPACGSASGRPCVDYGERRTEHPERIKLAERVAASKAAQERGRSLAAGRRPPPR